MSEPDFVKAVESLQEEWKELVAVEVTDTIFSDLLSVAKNYPLRGVDAIHLCTALWFRSRVKAEVLFVCCDRNLLTAAEKERFDTCDPAEQEEKEKL